MNGSNPNEKVSLESVNDYVVQVLSTHSLSTGQKERLKVKKLNRIHRNEHTSCEPQENIKQPSVLVVMKFN